MLRESPKFSICADVAHDGHKTAMDIYRAHETRPKQFNASGWLLYFTDPEIARLEALVHGILKPEGVILPMLDVDALSTRAISIYTYGDGNLVDLMQRARKVTINLINPA